MAASSAMQCIGASAAVALLSKSGGSVTPSKTVEAAASNLQSSREEPDLARPSIDPGLNYLKERCRASRRKSALHQESYRWIDDTTKDFGGDVTPPTSVGGAPTPAPPLLELLLQRPATPPHRWSSKSTSTVAGLPTPATSDTTS